MHPYQRPSPRAASAAHNLQTNPARTNNQRNHPRDSSPYSDTASYSDRGADEGDDDAVKPSMSRHNSDASLASRALTLEEGRLHRLGHHLRREIVESSPVTSSSAIASEDDERPPRPAAGQQRLAILKERLESTPGNELGPLVEKIARRLMAADYQDQRGERGLAVLLKSWKG